MNGLISIFPVGGGQTRPLWLGDFCNAKGQREIQITLAFLASHEARRRMAVFTD